jgi:hypothetical protein
MFGARVKFVVVSAVTAIAVAAGVAGLAPASASEVPVPDPVLVVQCVESLVSTLLYSTPPNVSCMVLNP